MFFSWATATLFDIEISDQEKSSPWGRWLKQMPKYNAWLQKMYTSISLRQKAFIQDTPTPLEIPIKLDASYYLNFYLNVLVLENPYPQENSNPFCGGEYGIFSGIAQFIDCYMVKYGNLCK